MAGHAKGQAQTLMTKLGLLGSELLLRQEDVSQSEDVPQSHESREREPAPAKLSPALEIFAKCAGA